MNGQDVAAEEKTEAGAPTTVVQDAEQEAQYVDVVFGGNPAEETSVGGPVKPRRSFAPWHHPVKQIVREFQWVDQVKRLIEKHRPEQHRQTLRYFTLPGADLLDVRVLAEALVSSDTRIEYFGFDSGYKGVADELGDNEESSKAGAVYLPTESALRQAGRITDGAEVLGDRLEDIAVEGSQAANRLRQKDVFDVVNIDACDHLGYVPKGRTKSVFVGSSRVDLQACKLEYSIVSPK